MHVTRLKTEKDLTLKSHQFLKLCWSKKKEPFSQICLAGTNRDFYHKQTLNMNLTAPRAPERLLTVKLNHNNHKIEIGREIQPTLYFYEHSIFQNTLGL